MYDRVLVPIDGSAFAHVALPHALRLSPREIVLMAVVESAAHELARQVGIATDIPSDVAQEVERAALAEREAQLHDAENGLRQLGYAGPVRRVLRHGKPGPEIVGMVAELGCDAVVMATHGRTGLRRALLGSVADHVVSHLVGTPVVLVRPADHAGHD